MITKLSGHGRTSDQVLIGMRIVPLLVGPLSTYQVLDGENYGIHGYFMGRQRPWFTT
jgi:hypothetical protein